MRAKWLSFDCYGTLIDWKKGIETNFEKYAKFKNDIGIDIFNSYVSLEARNEHNYSSYRNILASTFLELSHKLGLSPTEEDAISFSMSIGKWPPFNDTVQTLKYLGSIGVRRVILSNVDRDLLDETVRNAHLEVDGYVTADEVGSYKPSPSHWLRMLKKFNIDNTDVIHVAGSIYHDIIPASNLGFRTVWVNRYNDPAPAGIRLGHSVKSLSEVSKLLG